MITPRSPWPKSLEEKWDSCVECSNSKTQVEIRFHYGTVAPTVGETLTGAYSGNTGKVVSSNLESGTYAGGDAVGTVTLESCVGITNMDSGTESWGADGETINGSTGGAGMLSMSDIGFVKRYGRLWPKTQLIFRAGKYYCLEHYAWKFHKQDMADARLSINEWGGQY